MPVEEEYGVNVVYLGHKQYSSIKPAQRGCVPGKAEEQMKKRHIAYGTVVVVLALVIGGRIYLPYWLQDYVNSTLDNIDGYSGSVGDIEVNLFRGAYVIKEIVIKKAQGSQEVPFVTVATVDLSVQWRALFDGVVVAEVDLAKPVVHFVAATSGAGDNEQTGEEIDWTEPLRKLLPFRINRLTASDGILFYHDFSSNPTVDISLGQLELLVTNISNTSTTTESLPSTLTATAVSIGDGKLQVHSKLNLVKKIPDIDLELKFEQVNLPALNDFLKAYAGVDAETGTFFLYSEIVVKDGQLSGYVKPILTNVSLVDWGEGEKELLHKIWESIVGTVSELFENQPKDQLATKVPLEGDLNQPDTAIFPTIWNIFRNAFIQAFARNTDGTVKFTAQKQQNEPDG